MTIALEKRGATSRTPALDNLIFRFFTLGCSYEFAATFPEAERNTSRAVGKWHRAVADFLNGLRDDGRQVELVELLGKDALAAVDDISFDVIPEWAARDGEPSEEAVAEIVAVLVELASFPDSCLCCSEATRYSNATEEVKCT